MDQAYSQPAQVPSLILIMDIRMISYFVSRTATDGLPAGDIVDMYKMLKLAIQIQELCATQKCERIVFTIS